jgi:hypothetical protein
MIIQDNRDRSRSPPRYNDRRGDDRRYDSSRHEHRDRRNSYRNDDSKWPSRDTGGHHHQNRSYQNYNEPKTTLVIKGVPQGMPADTIRAELEKMDLFVRTCQLATTREPGTNQCGRISTSNRLCGHFITIRARRT